MLALPNISAQISFLFNGKNEWSTPYTHFTFESRSSGFTDLDAILPRSGWSNQTVHEILIPSKAQLEFSILLPVLRQIAQGTGSILLYQPPTPEIISFFTQCGIPEARIRVIQSDHLSLEWFLSETLRSYPGSALLAWVGDGRHDIMKALVKTAQQKNGIIFALSDMHNFTNAYKNVVRLYTEPKALRHSSENAESELLLRIVNHKGKPISDTLTIDCNAAMRPVIPLGIAYNRNSNVFHRPHSDSHNTHGARKATITPARPTNTINQYKPVLVKKVLPAQRANKTKLDI